MSTNNDGTDLDYECDYCGELETFPSGDSFSDCWEQLKNDGWRCFKEDGDWKQKCPGCMEKLV